MRGSPTSACLLFFRAFSTSAGVGAILSSNGTSTNTNAVNAADTTISGASGR